MTHNVTYPSSSIPADTGPSSDEEVKDFKDKAASALHDLRDGAARTAQDAQRTAAEQLRNGQDFVAAAGQELGETVRKNPGLALAGAVGVGVLIGLAIKSRR